MYKYIGSVSMVVNYIDTLQKNCSEMIYSEQFFDYMVRYNGNLSAISEAFGDDVCINAVNNQYAVVYKKITDAGQNIENMLEPGFRFIPKCYGLMDAYAYEKSGAAEAASLPGLSISGENVLVGFVDTGIDYTLDMFRTKSGRTRIKYIWNQNAPYRETETGHFGFGSVYTSDEIDYALTLDDPYSAVPVRDTNGHGTFLASVAGGAGVGIAENAEFAVVSLKEAKESLRSFYQIPFDEPCFAETDIILAVRFLIEAAAREGKPMVICLGIGSSQGAHLGKSMLEDYLSYIGSYRGICVVSAVGNENLSGSHFRGRGNVEISADEFISGFSMELWSSRLVYLDVSLVSPTGEIFNGINPRRNGYYHKKFVYEGTEADVVNVAIDETAGVQMVFIRLKNVTAGIWQLSVTESEISRGEGFDAWLPIKQYTKGKVYFATPASEVTICAPGSAAGVITAAAYNVADDSIYAYSSRGFNRQDLVKPDIAASGVSVIGAFSGGGKSSMDLLTVKSGSSVAAAVLAGLAALVLEWGLIKENAPYISTAEIRHFFIQGAVRKDYLAYPNVSFGWGTVDLLNSFQRLRL